MSAAMAIVVNSAVIVAAANSLFIFIVDSPRLDIGSLVTIKLIASTGAGAGKRFHLITKPRVGMPTFGRKFALKGRKRRVNYVPSMYYSSKFQTANVAVELNRTNTANLTVQVGPVATTVDIRESAVTIDTTTAQV